MQPQKESHQQNTSHQESCPVCMQLLYLPHLFPGCSHVFCKLCLQFLEEHEDQMKCPLCRTNGKIQDLLPLPRLEAKLQKDHPEQYQERRKAYEVEIKKVPVTFVYGNRTKVMKREKNNYLWTFFIQSKSGKTEDYIEKVELQLHPTFRPSLITLNQKPFQFAASGWGTFQIGIKIYWKPIMGGSFSEHSHLLQFQPLVQHKLTKRVETI